LFSNIRKTKVAVLFFFNSSDKNVRYKLLSAADTAIIDNNESEEQVLLSNTLSNPCTDIGLFLKVEPFLRKAISTIDPFLFKSTFSNPGCFSKYDFAERFFSKGLPFIFPIFY